MTSVKMDIDSVTIKLEPADSGYEVPSVPTLPSDVVVKQEPLDPDIDKDQNQMVLGPAVFGLQRVGTKQPPKPAPVVPVVPLNRRGMPARIRKKNRLFYDDDIVTEPSPRAKRPTPIKSPKKPPVKAATVPVINPITRNRQDDKIVKAKEKVKSGLQINLRPKNSKRNANPVPIKFRESVSKVEVKKELTKPTKQVTTPTKSNEPKSPKRQEVNKRVEVIQETTKHSPEIKHKNEQVVKSIKRSRDTHTPKTARSRLIKEFPLPRIKLETGEVKNANDIVVKRLLSDKKVGHKIGMRLRNLLKLPKAHRWVCYEWFYSDLDKALFEGENDFMICLRETFPDLKTRMLTRVQWTTIRRIMGKPRRCSSLFFEEERRELERKRNTIRVLQQRKLLGDVSMLMRDMPNEIPMQLLIGTKVTARLRKPQDGLYTGVVEGIDVANYAYRIAFDRIGLGSHSIPDYEVLAHEPPECINLLRLQARANAKLAKSSKAQSGASTTNTATTTFVAPRQFIGSKIEAIPTATATLSKSMQSGDNTMIGRYPTKLLEMIIRVTKLLKTKRRKINKLKEFNLHAEKERAKGETLSDEFQTSYAYTLIQLETLNQDLKKFLHELQELCKEIAPEPCHELLTLNTIRENCDEDAYGLVKRNNSGVGSVKNKRLVNLITSLTALMFQVKTLGANNANTLRGPYELSLLDDSMKRIKEKLSPFNYLTYQDNLEMHVQYVQKSLSKPLVDDTLNVAA